jgi:hypothetical protein
VLVGRDLSECAHLFMRETGEAMLQRHFSAVRRIDFDSAMELTADDFGEGLRLRRLQVTVGSGEEVNWRGSERRGAFAGREKGMRHSPGALSLLDERTQPPCQPVRSA